MTGVVEGADDEARGDVPDAAQEVVRALDPQPARDEGPGEDPEEETADDLPEDERQADGHERGDDREPHGDPAQAQRLTRDPTRVYEVGPGDGGAVGTRAEGLVAVESPGGRGVGEAFAKTGGRGDGVPEADVLPGVEPERARVVGARALRPGRRRGDEREGHGQYLRRAAG